MQDRRIFSGTTVQVVFLFTKVSKEGRAEGQEWEGRREGEKE